MLKINNYKNILYIIIFTLSPLFFTNSFSMDSPTFSLSKEKGSHIDVAQICGALTALNKGEKDVCFVPIQLTDVEKKIMSELKMNFPNTEDTSRPFGGDLSASASIGSVYSEAINESARNEMTDFFKTYTNASELENKFHVNVPELLSNIILEYSHKFITNFNNQSTDKDKIDVVYISLKAQKANDAFVHYKRWHYDGPGHRIDENADLKFAGVFVGKPTVFAPLMEKEKEERFKKLLQNQQIEYRDQDDLAKNGGIQGLAQRVISLLTEDQKKYAENSDKYRLIENEIQNVQQWTENMTEDNKTKIRRLYHRITRHEFMTEDLRQPEKHHVALFAMTGRNPAPHSEADMSEPRLFFGLRAYKGSKASESDIKVSRGRSENPRHF